MAAALTYEEVQDHIGHIGTYQIVVFALLSCIQLAGTPALAFNFFGAEMEHWCKVDELQHLPHSIQKTVAIPKDDDEYSQCEMFRLNYSQFTTEDFLTWNRSVMVGGDTGQMSCKSWVYDQSDFVSTIRSEWNLVCDDAWMVPFTSTMYFLGVLLGVIGFGYLSDKIGRRIAFFLSCCLTTTSGLLSTLAPNVAVFYVGRFFQGMARSGIYLTGFILILELVSSEWRNRLGVAMALNYAIGYMLLPWIAYGIRDHVRYQLAIYVPTAAFLFYVWVVKESPRWQVVKGQLKEAEQTIRHIADVNGASLPDGFTIKPIEKDDTAKRGTFLDLFRYPQMRKRTLVLYFHWFTCSLLYYGVALNMGSMAGSLHLNVFIAGALEIPANLICVFCMGWKRMGRRRTCGFSLVLAGIASFCAIPFVISDQNTWATIFLQMGKAFTTIGFSGIYVYTTEIFPTEVRHVGSGTSSACARVSAMAASYMGPPLADVWAPLPTLIFGVAGTLAGCLALLLPETLGCPMLQTIKEAEEFKGRNSSSKTEDSSKIFSVSVKL